jgi:hypothetical protein
LRSRSRNRDARPGDLVCFGEPGEAHHIAFWLGDGCILHATGREGVNAVVEEGLEDVDARPIASRGSLSSKFLAYRSLTTGRRARHRCHGSSGSAKIVAQFSVPPVFLN